MATADDPKTALTRAKAALDVPAENIVDEIRRLETALRLVIGFLVETRSR